MIMYYFYVTIQQRLFKKHCYNTGLPYLWPCGPRHRQEESGVQESTPKGVCQFQQKPKQSGSGVKFLYNEEEEPERPHSS